MGSECAGDKFKQAISSPFQKVYDKIAEYSVDSSEFAKFDSLGILLDELKDDVLAEFDKHQKQQQKQLQDFIHTIEKDYIFHEEHHSGYFISKIDWNLLKETLLSEGCDEK